MRKGPLNNVVGLMGKEKEAALDSEQKKAMEKKVGDVMMEENRVEDEGAGDDPKIGIKYSRCTKKEHMAAR